MVLQNGPSSKETSLHDALQIQRPRVLLGHGTGEVRMVLQWTLSKVPTKERYGVCRMEIRDLKKNHDILVNILQFVDSKSYWCSTAPLVATTLVYTVRCAVHEHFSPSTVRIRLSKLFGQKIRPSRSIIMWLNLFYNNCIITS